MTVKVSKPAINVREELADLKKPTGVAGEAMLRAETPQEQFNLIGAGRKNMVINGGFTVWQRGTSGVAANGFNIDAADRWYSVRGALSREYENSVPYCHMVHGNYADSCYINHRVEDFVHTLGKQVTISYKIKSDDGLGADGGIFIRYYNSSNAYTTALASTTYVYGSDWTTITYTFTMPTTAPKGASYGLEIFLYGDLNSVNNNGKSFDVKEVQLEVGDTATPFEHRSYGEELALCQRYYQVLANNSADLIATTHKWNSTNIFAFCDLPVEMRTQPSLDTNISTVSAALRVSSSGYNVTGNNLTLDGDSSPRKLRLNTTMNNSNFPSGSSGWLRVNSSTIYVNVDAEL